jgi:hypothetical protein
MRKLVGGLASLVLTALVLSTGILMPAPAAARVVVGVGIGPYWGGWPGPYPYPYYSGPPVVYAPPPVVYAPPPVIYAPTPAPATMVTGQAQSWYYCDNPKGYYPYVAACPAGWRQVPAQQH